MVYEGPDRSNSIRSMTKRGSAAIAALTMEMRSSSEAWMPFLCGGRGATINRISSSFIR